MKLDLFTARRILRAVVAGMPAESALWVVEQVLDGYDLIEALEEIMRKTLEGEHEEVEMLCKRMQGDFSPPTLEESLHG